MPSLSSLPITQRCSAWTARMPSTRRQKSSGSTLFLRSALHYHQQSEKCYLTSSCSRLPSGSSFCSAAIYIYGSHLLSFLATIEFQFQVDCRLQAADDQWGRRRRRRGRRQRRRPTRRAPETAGPWPWWRAALPLPLVATATTRPSRRGRRFLTSSMR